MRRAAALAALVAVGAAAGCGSGDGGAAAPPMATPAPPLRGAPPELAAVRRESNRLLEGGADAFKARLARLRGHPVVVNKWASWCPPCRAEFPFFARQATERGARVAFLGVNATDANDEAREFLRELPVPFPSYIDPDQEIARLFNGAASFPATGFYDSKGELAYVKLGGYSSEQKLASDIERYAR